MHRRDFLVRTGWALGAGAIAAGLPRGLAATEGAAAASDGWEALRAQFDLEPGLVHMSSFFLSSHPRPVREAIEIHRRGLDANPIAYWLDNIGRLEAAVLRAGADYLAVDPRDIALTDSTTMGLGLLYGGLKLREGQEIVTTVHDHYATETSLQLRAERTGATLRRVALYRDPAGATEDEIVDALVKAVTPKTRVAAVTWVHSCTGVKLPIRRMADALARINAGRADGDRVLLCVDGVHGLGAEDATLPGLGCDFFIAGTHKWLFGPRGTGIVWGKPEAWPAATAIIPTFDHDAYGMWMKVIPARAIPMAVQMTPGGFHSFEHRWALEAAFRLHLSLGKARVAERIHALNRKLKGGLAEMRHVRLRAPMSEALSAGIVTFEVEGMSPEQVVQRLWEKRIIASETPYATRYARLAPSLLTSPEDVEASLRAVRELAGRV